MIAFPGCKINIGLNITQKLSNGYHAIESVFVPVPLSDILEIIPQSSTDGSYFEYTGLTISGDPENNLIKKTFDLLDKQYPLNPVRVHLHKIVPMGAGLGGGSADASAMLIMLNELFKLKMNQHMLLNHAGYLGADCPFFVLNRPAFVTGTGEKIKPIDPGLKGKKILLVFPDIHISTPQAFQNIKPKKPGKNLVSIIRDYPISKWKDHIKNDFENYVFKLHPQIAGIKEKLYEMGAIYASLSGSGSTVYGIFDERTTETPGVFNSYFTFWGVL